MTPTTLDPFREAAALLTPGAVSRFLASQGWELESRKPDVREIWRLDGSSEFGPARIMLPLATDYVDFHKRFRDTLDSLCHVYDIDIKELRSRISLAKFDTLLVRLNQPSDNGSIPFRQAESTVESLFRMVKAAATTAADPLHSHRGRRPAVVSEFLDEYVRLGQTGEGSFVFCVFVDPTGPPLTNAEDDAGGPARTTFSRQVLTTLALGLRSTRRLALNRDEEAPESPAELGLSSSLVESLENMAEPREIRSLDFSFKWSTAEPEPEGQNEPIIVDRDVIIGLPEIRERLVRREEPPRRTTLFGTVKSLTREEPSSDEEEAAIVTLLTRIRGRTRSVHMALTGENHHWAIMSYLKKVPIGVTGDLAFERRAWRLTGDIAVDASFLKNSPEKRAHAGSEENST
ncbi:hypothetical protein SUDANB121_03787 [Nocardiopsis dassonvillei]|uniref:hypothetical protein n=1 Tax=Nocardiopsis dassonvillei TaxID=2014 RepID=UPI003F56BF48